MRMWLLSRTLTRRWSNEKYRVDQNVFTFSLISFRNVLTPNTIVKETKTGCKEDGGIKARHT